LREPLSQAQEAFFTSLDRFTLADVIRPRKALSPLLEKQSK
jgi:Rrf2 family transcriptional regulator, nitric oxide-sensitive transcriptional repressor